MSIEFQAISHKFDRHRVLADVSFALEDGEILCVIGPSGGGKSTLLRIAAGLEAVQSGQILLDGECLANKRHNPPPEQRSVGLVFQDHALFPHLTVEANVGFGLSHLTSEQKTQKVNDLLSSVALADLAQRYPHTLSGGQQQRIALVRALATEPRVMLLDEPFASVDTPLRRQLRQDARSSLKRSGTTTIMVTHDPEEAMAMADQILVLIDGSPVQLDTPAAIWSQPAHPFIAETIAGLQTLTGVIESDHVITRFGNLPLAKIRGAAGLPAGKTIRFGLRGSSINITQANADDPNAHVIADIRFDGSYWTALVQKEDQQLRVRLENQNQFSTGDWLRLAFTHAEAIAYN